MRLQLTEEQIIDLAPDEPSKKAGRDLANSAKWVSLGISELALWGECKGSGSKPYQTQVDLIGIAFKCSCPSRKFPCKHALGLLLLCARQPDLFKDQELPLWVNDWLSKRTEKAVNKTEKADKPVDEAAQAKRQEARDKKVSEGINELMLWIKDIVRNGILGIPEKDAAFWDNMSRRMIDAQATGLASMVKKLGATNFWNEGWQSGFLDSLLQLYLIAESYQRLPTINQLLQLDIRSSIGFTVNQEELKQQEGIHDIWLVLGKSSREEQQLRIEENWLYGTVTNRYAQVLQFIAPGQTNQLTLTPGTFLEAEVVYFPSALPYRALVKTQTTTTTPIDHALAYFSGWQQIAQEESALNSRFPFRNEMPFIVDALKPVQYQGTWWLQDQDGCLGKISLNFESIWQLLAISGGEPMAMAVIGKENQYCPIGIWHLERYKPLK